MLTLSSVTVGHKPIAVPEMVRVRARGLHRDCPHGVSHFDQITSHEGEPLRRARNLLSKQDWRASDLNKASEYWPEVSFVGEAFSLSADAEGLAGARAGPHGKILWPSGNREGKGPSTEAGEEMAVTELSQVIRPNIDN
jgi:hypothetical protein